MSIWNALLTFLGIKRQPDKPATPPVEGQRDLRTGEDMGAAVQTHDTPRADTAEISKDEHGKRRVRLVAGKRPKLAAKKPPKKHPK